MPFSLEPPKMISSRWEKYFSGEQSWDLRREKGISFAREMDFFCSKLCALLSSLLLCASVNITASLRFLQTFHLKLFSSKEKFFLREKLFSKEKFFVFSWWWKNYLAVAAAAFLSCLTACRRISPESGRENKSGNWRIIRQESRKESRREEKSGIIEEVWLWKVRGKCHLGYPPLGDLPIQSSVPHSLKLQSWKPDFISNVHGKLLASLWVCGLCAFLKVAVWADHLKGLPVVDVNLADLQW